MAEVDTAFVKYIQQAIPDLTLAVDERQVEQEIQEAIALTLYAKGYITSGMAARFLDISWVEFLFVAGRKHIPMYEYSEEELRRELENA